jgi:apolipoprotein N-acyltransferase
MNFLKAVFWVLMLVGFVFLAGLNWKSVDITVIPQQSVVSINLPLLLLVTFLIGFLPYFIIHRMTRWSLRKKLSQAKRELEASKHEVAPALPKDGE